MSDTYTSAITLRLIQTGTDPNSWGALLNTDALALLDNAIAGEVQVNIGSSSAFSVPPMTQGAASPSRYFAVQFVGTPTAPVTVTLPGSLISKFYLIDNFDTGQNLIFTYAGSTNTVTVQPGEKHLIWCDGENVWDCTTAPSTLLNGIASSNFARVSRTAAEITAATVVQNVFTGVTNVHPSTLLTLPGGGVITLDPTAGDVQAVELTGNYSMAAPVNTQEGCGIELYVRQDSTGTRTLTWASIFLFAGGAQPVLSTTPGAIDKFVMRYNAILGAWLVAFSLNITTPAGATYPLAINSNVTNWSLLPLLVGFAGGSVTVTVGPGVVVSSTETSQPAMDLSGLPSGSTVNLINNGYIIGKGGNGGNGAASTYNGTSSQVGQATPGRPGGNAILGPGLSRTFNVTNSNGHIWGGGGGGGAGAAQNSDSAPGVANAGGGGGGAGAGQGGYGGTFGQQSTQTQAPYGGDGANGPGGPNGVGGAAGAGTNAAAGQTGTSGAGGGYGAAGAPGVATSLTTAGYGPFSVGGAAGKAIEMQGATPPTVGGDVKGVIS